MKQLRMPQFIQNLYRDMRDRRMLLPAIALVVALIAVPMVLKSSSSSAPPPPASPSSDAGSSSAAEPAVVTEQLGVTDYRKRLDQLKSKNPFRKHFRALPGSAKLTTTSSASTTSTATSTTSATSAPSSSTPATIPPASPPASTGGSSTTPSGGSDNSGSKPRPSRFFAFRVSVAVGPAGKLTERNSVKRLAFLPGENRPLVAFIGVTEDAKRAIFAVSDDVSSVRGDGRCVPRRGACNFLELKRGDKATLRYAPERDRAFNLKLRGIKLVPVSGPHGGGNKKVGSGLALGPDG
jgi:hypothetical protein